MDHRLQHSDRRAALRNVPSAVEARGSIATFGQVRRDRGEIHPNECEIPHPRRPPVGRASFGVRGARLFQTVSAETGAAVRLVGRR